MADPTTAMEDGIAIAVLKNEATEALTIRDSWTIAGGKIKGDREEKSAREDELRRTPAKND